MSVEEEQSEKFAKTEERISLVQKPNSRKLLKKWMTRRQKVELLKDNIDWIKNLPSASNFGRLWESQIRSVRNVMNGLIRVHGNRLGEESLRTFLC